MSIPVAPFLKRSLQMDARSGRMYLLRAGLLLVMLLSLVSVQNMWAFLGAPGLQLFNAITGANAVLICLAGPAFFASVITDEKENMRLGLVKMTGLRPLWILLGLFGSQLLVAVLLLLVQVPFTVLAVTLGGISLDQVVAGYSALAGHLILVSGLGLLCSTVCARTRSAARLCGIVVGLFFIGVPVGRAVMAGMAMGGATSSGGFVETVLGGLLGWMRRASVFTRLSGVLATGFAGTAMAFQVWSNLGVGLLFFAASWAVFDRFTREQAPAGPARGLAFTGRSWLRVLGVGRSWRNALAWKDFHFMVGGRAAMLVRLVLVGCLVALIVIISRATGSRPDSEDVGGIVMVVALLMAFFDLTLQTSRVFGRERQWQTLTCIMILPRSTRGIAYSKVAGCLLGLLPYAAWFVVGAALCPDAVGDTVAEAVDQPAAWFFVAQVIFFLHLVAYLSVVMRRGALLLAFGIWVFGIQLLTSLVMSLIFVVGGWDAVFLAMVIAFVLVTVLLHQRTLRRLERAAAAE